MTPDTWRALAERNAPNWLIESGGAYDVIGAPQWTKTGVTIDPQRPYVYYMPTYARINGHAVIQLNYFIWFSEHPALTKHDPQAGRMDGLIWRVTLDGDGKPQLYDAMHMSGFDEMWFPMHAMLPRQQADGHQEPLLVPQQIDPKAAGALTVRLRSGTHTPRRLLVAGQVPAASAKAYELKEYDDLMTLEAPGGHSRSLFNTSGVVPGTERADALYRKVPVPHAGALRQWGTIPTALAARYYYDDPYLVDKLFVLTGRGNSAALEPVVPKAKAEAQFASTER
jgi:hypothetical protein